MKYILYLLILFPPIWNLCSAQDITFIPDKVLIQDTVGKEIVFNCRIKNISAIQQTVFLVRSKNIMPANWKSSLCFGNNCFPPTLDSLATTPVFNSSPLSPQEERDVSLHVFTSNLATGVAYIRLESGTIQNPTPRVILDFTAETVPTSVNDKVMTNIKFFLNQNYPNPFNPSTKIEYNLPRKGLVILQVYSVTGKLVITLVNELQKAGSYSVNFSGVNLSSGVYIYRLSINDKSLGKKMMLIK